MLLGCAIRTFRFQTPIPESGGKILFRHRARRQNCNPVLVAFGAAVDVKRVISRKGASAVVALEAIVPGCREMLTNGDE